MNTLEKIHHWYWLSS